MDLLIRAGYASRRSLSETNSVSTFKNFTVSTLNIMSLIRKKTSGEEEEQLIELVRKNVELFDLSHNKYKDAEH